LGGCQKEVFKFATLAILGCVSILNIFSKEHSATIYAMQEPKGGFINLAIILERSTVPKNSSNKWGRFQEVDRSDDGSSIVWASEGVGGSGKSHFLLTAPEPIAVHLFDPGGLKGLVNNELFKTKEIRVIQYSFNPGKLSVDDRPKAAQDALEEFLENQGVALKNARTIGFDKEDHVWEMLRYARLEAVSDRPANYYELNLEYRGWFHDAEIAGVNLGVIRGMKEKWGKTGSNREGKATYGSLGELEPRGQREVPELVQIVLRHRWDNEAKEFMVKVHEKCRIGPAKELIGEEFSGLDFPTLASLVYPEGDWQ
jgi:hypothetical protein